MGPAQTALRYQRLHSDARRLRSEIARTEQHLSTDPAIGRLEAELAGAQAGRTELEQRTRSVDRDTEQLRGRVEAREQELMGGRLRDSGGLLRLRDEVEHLKSTLAGAEDAELTLLEDLDRQDVEVRALERTLEERKAEAGRARPELEQRREEAGAQLKTVEAEEREAWEELPPDWRAVIERAQSHHPDPVSQVVDGQCASCRVAVTSSAAHVLRHGELLTCDNCGRLLVIG